MQKITIKNPIVELDGDEMARVIWGWIREQLILPFLDVELIRYDLGLPHRDATDDQVTTDSAEAVKVHHVGVKCAAINPDQARVEEYGLKKALAFAQCPCAQHHRRHAVPPAGDLPQRAAPGGSLGTADRRRPVMPSPANSPPPISAFRVPACCACASKPRDGGSPIEHTVLDYPGAGIAMGMYNLDDSIEGFARSCMNFGLEHGYPVYLGTKNTALKAYDNRFKEIFQEVYERDFKADMEAAGLFYEHRLVDELAAFVIKSKGGFVYAWPQPRRRHRVRLGGGGVRLRSA